MSFFFKQKSKPSHDHVRFVCEQLPRLSASSEHKKPFDEVCRALQSIKSTLCGTTDVPPRPDQVSNLRLEIYQSNLLNVLVRYLPVLGFEARKDTAVIFSALLHNQISSRYPSVDYLLANQDIFPILLRYYNSPDVAFTAGNILRECAFHKALCSVILELPEFWLLFKFVKSPSFDLASDAFSTFKALLIQHKPLVAGFIVQHYNDFFIQYTLLLTSDNYVTKRQSLKLLGELLLNRTNYPVMTRYIASAENLKLMMILLRDKSKNIQFEAFHVFKLFVANPEKSVEVLDILRKNKSKLLTYLSSFHLDRKNDEQFNDERAFVIKQVEKLH
ncbi:mo25 family protein Pmo25 [Schizosaccharomyces japonicus yFS275]|uniref:Mo25 family protein Pmo25 n=1 Tax=Schizosaccharomyces japonicus (strain yFS275 / FY16936) TaxID=402676 RepID=B6JVC6_SCHJY|nr:mo25 family protein Pmo25 [Schizosaccharomyces japonicus yFS275]EEB05327.1 mo25 family protein Pmo25 [Schizosaccharomyces japonicus yFS275]